ncbi:hypothetical protein ACLKA7_000119 [Drosophila subpalustris]
MEASQQQNKSRFELFDNEERVKLIEEVQQRAIVWDLTDKKQKSKARHGTSVEGGDRQAGEDNRQAVKNAIWLLLSGEGTAGATQALTKLHWEFEKEPDH